MRHNISGRKLNRPTSHRKALFSNLVCSLIEHEQITTTLPKAKDLRSFADKMITIAKKNSLAARREALAFLRSEEAVKKLFDVLGKRYEKRNGGYTRVIKAGLRYGDCAPMGIIEFVDRDVNAKGLRQKNDKFPSYWTLTVAILQQSLQPNREHMSAFPLDQKQLLIRCVPHPTDALF